MTAAVAFLVLLAALAAWWLSGQRLMSRPWLAAGVVEDTGGLSHMPAAKVGLGVFLAVIGALFSLFLSAYTMRMQLADWSALPVPRILWVTTLLILLASAALVWAVRSARRGEKERALDGLLAATGLGSAFLGGQLIAWDELAGSGYRLADNAANSFFYVLTGLHGAHILGGLVAVVAVTVKLWRSPEAAAARLPVELCALYWHFLALVWLVLFAVITGWAGDFLAVCRQLLS